MVFSRFSMGRTVAMVLAAILAGGCVTINIYFPAAAAEKAADRIIEDVWQLKKSEEAGQKPGKPESSKPAESPKP